jgi:hypothetical protein
VQHFFDADKKFSVFCLANVTSKMKKGDRVVLAHNVIATFAAKERRLLKFDVVLPLDDVLVLFKNASLLASVENGLCIHIYFSDCVIVRNASSILRTFFENAIRRRRFRKIEEELMMMACRPSRLFQI